MNTSTKQIKSVVLIGTGNVATSLSTAFTQHNIQVVHVYGRNIQKAETLSKKLSCSFGSSLSDLPIAGLYLVCVKDEAVKEIASRVQIPQTSIIAHTSGTLSIDLLKQFHINCGVCYPLQTFNEQSTDSIHIPFLVEGSDESVLNVLSGFCKLISKQVITADSLTREKIHLSAVFANNFANHIIYAALDLLKENQIDSSILLPLIQETFNNILKKDPFLTQTGPAKRNDNQTIEKHIKSLQDHPEYLKIYQAITDSIKHTYGKR